MVICTGMNALCHRRQHPASSSPQRLTKSDPAGDFCTSERERISWRRALCTGSGLGDVLHVGADEDQAAGPPLAITSRAVGCC